MSVEHAVRWSLDHAQPPAVVRRALRLVVTPLRVGNDGLTDRERAADVALFKATVGATPAGGAAHAEHLDQLSEKLGYRQRPRPRHHAPAG